MAAPLDRTRARRRRVLSHQCPYCHRLWALSLADGPAGRVVLCRFCMAVRQALPYPPVLEDSGS